MSRWDILAKSSGKKPELLGVKTELIWLAAHAILEGNQTSIFLGRKAHESSSTVIYFS
ncbi:MAG: hypothetical protein QNJ37_06975 [Crocosphaera sp.]|nr:hypothetical protein [Crocosphaera sp.]